MDYNDNSVSFFYEMKVWEEMPRRQNLLLWLLVLNNLSTNNFSSGFSISISLSLKLIFNLRLWLFTIWPLILFLPECKKAQFLNQPSKGKQSVLCKGPYFST